MVNGNLLRRLSTEEELSKSDAASNELSAILEDISKNVEKKI